MTLPPFGVPTAGDPGPRDPRLRRAEVRAGPLRPAELEHRPARRRLRPAGRRDRRHPPAARAARSSATTRPARSSSPSGGPTAPATTRSTPSTARHSGGDDRPDGPALGRTADGDVAAPEHPSAPLPPRPAAGRVGPAASRATAPVDDDETVAQPTVGRAPLDSRRGRARLPGQWARTGRTTTTPTRTRSTRGVDDARAWEDQTGGLEVIGAHVEEDAPRRRGRRARREREEASARRRCARRRPVRRARGHRPPPRPDGRRRARARRGVRRGHPGQALRPADRPRAAASAARSPSWCRCWCSPASSLGIVVGGQKLLALINPASRDYTGQGTGEVQIRVQDGDTLSDIARTLVKADVIASVGPFVDAAEANADAVGIQPGVYGMRLQMSGQAALDLLLDPAARLLSRVTVPEGLTVARTLARLAEQTGTPIEELKAAAADPAALGPAGLRQRLAGGLPLPGDLRRRARHRAGRHPQADGRPRRAGARRAADPRGRAAHGADQGEHRAGRGRARSRTWARWPGCWRTGSPTACRCSWTPRSTTPTARPASPRPPQDRQNPSPYNTYLHPGLHARPDQQPRRGGAARGAEPRPRATGASSSWSTPTPARPGSP